jgi:hypothetical protein
MDSLGGITHNWYYLVGNEAWKRYEFEVKSKIELLFLLACVPLRKVEFIAV